MLKEYAQGVLDEFQPGPLAILNLVFVGTRKMRDIASTYKNERIALPVLSFSYLHERATTDNVIGEIFLCYPQIVLLAAERNKKVDEMCRQMIRHGMENIFS